MRCPECHAAVTADEQMCGQCHAWLPHYEPPDPSAPVRQRISESIALAGPPKYSRWRSSEVGFSGPTRILLTLLLVAIGVALILLENPLSIGIWWLLAVPLGLRSVWARKRVTS